MQPIQKELYLKGCGRYAERNPVGARIVQEAYEYPHSSARFYCLGQKDNLTQASPVFEDFGTDTFKRQSAYIEFLKTFDSEEERYFSNIEIPCGDKEFVRRLIKIGTHYLPRRQGRKPGIFLP